MDKHNRHPEVLPFEPEGNGWTTVEPVPTVSRRPLLLTSNNIAAIRRNHPIEWTAKAETLGAVGITGRDPRTGRPTGLNEDEIERLIALRILVDRGVITDDGHDQHKEGH